MYGKSFSFSKVLGFGWRVMKANFWFFAGVVTILVLISSLEQILGYAIERQPEQTQLFVGLSLFPVIFIIQTILAIGFTKITLSFCDGQKPKFSTLFNVRDCFWRYIGTGILLFLIIWCAVFACMLPLYLLAAATGIPRLAGLAVILAIVWIVILLTKFGLCFYFVVDKGLGPVKALRASSRTTAGVKWRLFGFGILCGLINFLGTLCLFVGIFATFPMVMVAITLVYRQLSAQTLGLKEFGIGRPDIQPASNIQPASDIQPGSDIQYILGIQPSSGVRPSSGILPNSGILPSSGTRPGPGTKPSPDIQAGPDTKPGPDVQPGPETQPDIEKKKSNFLPYVLLLGVAVMIVAGIGYYFWPEVKDSVLFDRDMSITAIIYAEDNSSAIVEGKVVHEGDMIGDTKVVGIYKDEVEFENADEKWTQRVSGAGDTLPKMVLLGSYGSPPCRKMVPILDELKNEYKGKFQVKYIDAWKNGAKSTKYGVSEVPTQIFYDNKGREVYRHVGYFSKEDILETWRKFGVKL